MPAARRCAMTTNSPQSRLEPAAKKSLPWRSRSEEVDVVGKYVDGQCVGEYVDGQFVHARGPLPPAITAGVKKLLQHREKNTSAATKLESTTGDDDSSEPEIHFLSGTASEVRERMFGKRAGDVDLDSESVALGPSSSSGTAVAAAAGGLESASEALDASASSGTAVADAARGSDDKAGHAPKKQRDTAPQLRSRDSSDSPPRPTSAEDKYKAPRRLPPRARDSRRQERHRLSAQLLRAARGRSRSPVRGQVTLSARERHAPFAEGKTLREALDKMGFGEGCEGSKQLSVGVSAAQLSAVAERLMSPPRGKMYFNSDLALGNIMMATFTASQTAPADELLAAIANAPFDVTIIQPTPNGFGDETWMKLRAAAKAIQDEVSGFADDAENIEDGIVRQLVQEKYVYEVMPGTFVAAHRVKIHAVTTKRFFMPQSRRKGDASYEFGGQQLGYVKVDFASRDDYIRAPSLKFLVGYCPRALRDFQTTAIVDTIARTNVAAMAGFWGGGGVNTMPLQQIGNRTRATGAGALTTPFSIANRSSGFLRGSVARTRKVVFLPTYFILFGQYRSLQSRRDLPPDADWEAVENEADLAGSDVSDLTELLSRSVPLWEEGAHGSPFTPHMGTVHLKKHKPSLWPPGVVELPIWVGRSVPGKGARARRAAHAREKTISWRAKKEAMRDD